ncbi:MAG TPA: response regulator [Xanthobacteraceae bacterium]|nr:response regulator [Xanthobacteraceae bacterium]
MAALTMATGEVYIVDDDPAVRTTLSAVFTRAGYQVTCFADGAALVAAARIGTPVCIILDVHIPGKSGLDILKQLNAQDYPVPIFMMSGQGDIAMAVDAIKNGALDFIEKPFRGSDVIARVEAAIEARTEREEGEAARDSRRFYFPGREPLSRREQDVLGEIVNGASNKEAGRKLGISPRTIEVHRAHLMQKIGARNAADLIRIVMSEGRTQQ